MQTNNNEYLSNEMIGKKSLSLFGKWKKRNQNLLMKNQMMIRLSFLSILSES